MRASLALIAGVWAVAATAQEAPAERIVLGLSSDRVAITATFDGDDILVFGAVRRDAPPPEGAPLEVVIAVSGPLRPLVVRKAERTAGIWLNRGAAGIDAAPSFYAVTTTGPFEQAMSDTEDLRHSVSIARAIRAVGTEVEDRQDYIDALIRLRERSGAYRVIEGGVDLEEETLFRARVDLPANLVEGDFRARIFLTRGGVVIDSYGTDIAVRKVGMERWLHALSIEHPLPYGLLALGLAIGAGWAAQAAFAQLRN